MIGSNKTETIDLSVNAQTIFLYSVINKFLRSFSSKLTRNAIGQLILFILLFSGVAFSAEFNGHVVHIADGDTLTILTGGNEQIKVRLAEIDAPEKKQPFGQRSKQSLSDLCFNKDATLQKTDTDRFGRTVAKVYCDGAYANSEQVRAGMAWAYRKYLHDKSLLDLEQEARIAKRGLWAKINPLPPWEYRRRKLDRE